MIWSGLTPLLLPLVLLSEVFVYRSMIKGNDPVSDMGLLWEVFRVLSAPGLSDSSFCNAMVKVIHDFISVGYPCPSSGSCQSDIVDALFPRAVSNSQAFIGPVGSSTLAGARSMFRDGFNRRWAARDTIPRSAFYAWLISFAVRAQHQFGVASGGSAFDGFGRFDLAKALFREAAVPRIKRC